MISVVIPAFNEEKLIKETLESLKNQDFRGEYEIIVVDNNSKDNTAGVAREMGVKVVNCLQKGVSNARQAGAYAAQGEIIVQADADTIYPEWWLSRISKKFSKKTGVIAVAGTFIYKSPPRWAFIEYFLRASFNLFSAFFFGRPFIISGANFAFRKRGLIEIGGYDQNTYSSDQFDISTRLSKQGKVIFDSSSWCATSDRSVARPLKEIIKAFFGHIFTFTGNLLKSKKTGGNKGSKKPLSISTYFIIFVSLLVVGFICYGYFVPASPVFGKVYYRALTGDKVIALTFDDGPNEPYTSKILDILNEYDVDATFFAIGANVNKNPDVARRIIEDGSIIGNHSNTHNANHALYFDYYKDIEAAQLSIYEVTGVEPHLYRPPHGKKSPWELEQIKNRGYIEVLWNITTNDQSGNPPEFLAKEIIRKAKPGGIILLHDGYGILHDTIKSNRQMTVDMLPAIIQELKAQGYTFLTIPEMFNVPAYEQVKD